ncbi:Uncharacterized protein DAT39_016875, partial [Clarias magur]
MGWRSRPWGWYKDTALKDGVEIWPTAIEILMVFRCSLKEWGGELSHGDGVKMQPTRLGLGQSCLASVHAEWYRTTWKWEGYAYGIGKEIKLAGIGW